ncbi:MAG: hypothetical protein F3745_01105 [Nitrospinae bacterium]|nr:hypothetical protein [Nitrospinota bacterium]
MNEHKKIINLKFLNKILITLWVFITWLFLPSIGYTQSTAPTTDDNARIVLAPYAQAVPNDSYTFMAINHSSLDTALTQIGVAIEVLGMTTVPDNEAGRAAIFTIDAGETHRIFVVNVSHSTINSSNSAINDSRTHLILTADSAQFGRVRAVSLNDNPITPTTVNSIRKYNNLSQLSFWGVVFVESSGTGFAMEFIGDAHDSTIGRNINIPLEGASGVSSGVARGIN